MRCRSVCPPDIVCAEELRKANHEHKRGLEPSRGEEAIHFQSGLPICQRLKLY